MAALLVLLLENDQECAERYLDHYIIDHYKGLLLSKEPSKNDKDSRPSDHTIQHYQKLHDDLLERHGQQYKNPYGWASEVLNHKHPQFSHIEHYARLAHMRTQYKLASHRIHAGANGFNESLGAQRLDSLTMCYALQAVKALQDVSGSVPAPYPPNHNGSA